jgi:hypothetical protein
MVPPVERSMGLQSPDDPDPGIPVFLVLKKLIISQVEGKGKFGVRDSGIGARKFWIADFESVSERLHRGFPRGKRANPNAFSPCRSKIPRPLAAMDLQWLIDHL